MSMLTPGMIQDLWGLQLKQHGGPSVRKGTQNSGYKIRFKEVKTYLKKITIFKKLKNTTAL